MIQLSRKVEFEASHFYTTAHATPAENFAAFGKASNSHGHNWVLWATFAGDVDPCTGMVVNIKDIDDLLDERIVAVLDHRCINLDHPHFKTRLPTCENLAQFVWSEVEGAVANCRLMRVRMVESESLWADYRGQTDERSGQPVLYLTRAYEFCASHRLNEPALTAEENRHLFGKCGNPSGHGHNYRVEVTVTDDVDDRGMVVDLDWLDGIVATKILERFDFKHLNTDLVEFAEMNPTSENVVRVIFDTLKPHFESVAPRLHRVRLYETPKSWFDCGDAE